MMSTAPTPISTPRPAVPEHVSLAIDGALQRVAADRFETASAFADALQRPGVTATRPSGRGRAARLTAWPWVLGATAVVIAALPATAPARHVTRSAAEAS